MEFTHSWSWMRPDHRGPPILNFFPQSLHNWGTTGPNPGRYLTLLFWRWTGDQDTDAISKQCTNRNCQKQENKAITESYNHRSTLEHQICPWHTRTTFNIFYTTYFLVPISETFQECIVSNHELIFLSMTNICQIEKSTYLVGGSPPNWL